MTEDSAQHGVCELDRLVPTEPPHVLAFAGSRAGFAVGGDGVPQIEMGVALRPWMHIDTDELRISARETSLFEDLANGCLLRRLARVDVPARLHPPTDPAMEVQEHTTRAGDDRRGGDMRRVGVLVEGPLETVELDEEASLRLRFPFVDRR